ncbi:unnamed protein product [Gadus morhua 'NCC']
MGALLPSNEPPGSPLSTGRSEWFQSGLDPGRGPARRLGVRAGGDFLFNSWALVPGPGATAAVLTPPRESFHMGSEAAAVQCCLSSPPHQQRRKGLLITGGCAGNATA